MHSIQRPLLMWLACTITAVLPVMATAQDTAAPAKMRAPVAQPALKQSPAPQSRSAQSYCVREANRRGFVVLDTRNYQQFQDGWSVDMRVRDGRGKSMDGSCFVETRSGNVTLYGFGWGYNDDGDDRMQFNCASIDNKYRECQLPVTGRATLVKRQSHAACVEGRSWGQRGDRVWVDQGCRAVFEVNRYSAAGGNRQVDCNSDQNRYRECAIGAGYFGRLVRENSRARCLEGQTWGTRNGVIWVTDGCRGRFDIVRGNGGGGGQGGQELFDCRSSNGLFRECSIGRGNSARLVREYSSGRCRVNSTWGVRDGHVWVTSGCMAQFQRIKGGG